MACSSPSLSPFPRVWRVTSPLVENPTFFVGYVCIRGTPQRQVGESRRTAEAPFCCTVEAYWLRGYIVQGAAGRRCVAPVAALPVDGLLFAVILASSAGLDGHFAACQFSHIFVGYFCIRGTPQRQVGESRRAAEAPFCCTVEAYWLRGYIVQGAAGRQLGWWWSGGVLGFSPGRLAARGVSWRLRAWHTA